MGQPPSGICTLGVVFMSSKTIGETARFLGFYANVKFYCSLDMTFSRILVFHSNCFVFLENVGRFANELFKANRQFANVLGRFTNVRSSVHQPHILRVLFTVFKAKLIKA